MRNQSLVPMTIAIAGAFFALTARAPSAAGVELPEVFQPIGAAGMGGAGTSVANDDEAVWSNPAGISRIRKARSRNKFHVMKIPGLIVGFNQDGKAAAQGLLGGTDAKELGDVEVDIEKLQDKPFWGRAAAFPMTQFDLGKNRPIALGFFTNTNLKMTADQGSVDSVRVDAVSDQGALLGYALSSASNRFSIGAQLRPTFRYAYEDSIPSTVFTGTKQERDKEFESRTRAGANKTKGLGIDAGMIWTFADFWYPTLGVALYNYPGGCRDNYLNPYSQKREKVCGTKFTGNIGNEEALSTIDPTDLRVGFSVAPRIHRELGLRFAVEAHHLYITESGQYDGLNGVDARKLLHAGVEIYSGNPLEVPPFALRFGAGQGFASWGVVMRAPLLTLHATYYGRDISSDATPREDRRFLGGVSIDL